MDLVEWPWLKELGEVVDETLPASVTGRSRSFNGASLLMLLAMQWKEKSQNRAEGFLAENWAEIRNHGLKHGVALHEQPPRWEYLRTIRQHDDYNKLFEALDGPFISAAIATADAIGLLPGRSDGLIVPDRVGHLIGDGTVFTPMTSVGIDDNGNVRGSRATQLAPRLSERLVTTKNGAVLTGYPVAFWTLHGHQRWQRVIMAIAPHPNGDEIVVAEAALHRILDHTDRVTTIGYDMLMQGATQQRIMARGVLPVVEHCQADKKNANDPRKCIRLPDELVPVRGSKASKESRKGKGRRRRSGDAPREKRFLGVAQLPDAIHETTNGPCRHKLAAIDTCLVVHDGGSDPQWWHRTEVPPITRVERHDNPDGSTSLVGVWRLRCEHMDRANRYFEHRIELSGKIGNALTANRINAYPYLHPQSSPIYRWRNDIESTNRWLKYHRPERGRSSTMKYDDFLIDIIGGAIFNNATAFALWSPRKPEQTVLKQPWECSGRRGTGV